MRVLFDTNILMSQIGRNSDNEKKLSKTASFIIKRCDELNWTKCISERTLREFEKGWENGKIPKDKLTKEKSLLKKFVILHYHFGNESWEKIDGKWENIYSLWDNIEESKIADEIQRHLPADKHQHDRGILLDAIYNKCEIVISENWSDFGRICNVGEKYGVIVSKPDNFEKVS